MKKAILIFFFFVLAFTRTARIDWGLPYPFHPDERNMAVSVQQLRCETISISHLKQSLSDCFNPHFFAYGQLPLYASFIVVNGIKLFEGTMQSPIQFEEATKALRFVSTICSIALFLVLLIILKRLTEGKKHSFGIQLSIIVALIFQPYAIQFAHFGTTETMLMLMYSCVFLLVLEMINRKKQNTVILYIKVGLLLGCAVGIKTSSFLFAVLPLGASLYKAIKEKERLSGFIHNLILFSCAFLTAYFITSPHNVLHWDEFIRSMEYESAVGIGSFIPFYTRQFMHTTPILFQAFSILPYTLGIPLFVLSLLGFVFLPWNKQEINLLRVAICIYLLPHCFFFAKWTRFIAPVFPLLSLMGILFALRAIKNGLLSQPFKRIFSIGLFVCISLPGMLFFRIYMTEDVRFRASEWIYSHVAEGSKILSETNNVVDIPIVVPGSITKPRQYAYLSFNFYDVDTDVDLAQTLQRRIQEADYIIVPSRRIFLNHTCQNPDRVSYKSRFICAALEKQYPLLNTYYARLFSGEYNFEKVAEFTSFPGISFFGSPIIEFSDESAEETWTVFDHPVIRIYKRKTQQNITPNYLDFSAYKVKKISIEQSEFTVLVADTPKKWERGLMYVTSKKDIQGFDGMIFEFPDSQIRTFWNKNTLIDLDLYWMENDMLVEKNTLSSINKTGVIEMISSEKKVNKVIEIINEQ